METNTTHPALENYTGPDCGLAGLVHHDTLIEYCWSFKERLRAINRKPAYQIATRKSCLVYLDPTGQPWEATYLTHEQELRRFAKASEAYEKAVLVEDKEWKARRRIYRTTDNVTEEEILQSWAPIHRAAAVVRRTWEAKYKLWADYDKAWEALYRYAPQIEAQIRTLVPDLDQYWNGTELIFAEEQYRLMSPPH